MDYVSIFLAGVVLGIFACVTLYALIVAFRPTPPTMYHRRRAVEPPPNMAQVPEEYGINYLWLSQTGEERE